ncbi:uncharacterized protein LOC127848588 [Dreissena polymorpha]|uniref:Uncharacterized protein n=1 Tax=Dreissena polymorpha TaxID=45954 RepID=A0A9D4DG06_DREPO|nr:uncharacterized protein LOC127848588 [Dreissena polymorpha]KAH3746899.1 hypothetical protein DPMN_181317 [Dreissena polymorpha]
MAESDKPFAEIDSIRIRIEHLNLKFKKLNLEALKVFQKIKSMDTELNEAELDDALKALDKYQAAQDDISNEAKKYMDGVKDLKIKLLQEHRQVQIREQTGRKKVTDSGIGSAGFVGSVGISAERLSVPVQTTDEGQQPSLISLSGPSGLSLTSLNLNRNGDDDYTC